MGRSRENNNNFINSNKLLVRSAPGYLKVDPLPVCVLHVGDVDLELHRVPVVRQSLADVELRQRRDRDRSHLLLLEKRNFS